MSWPKNVSTTARVTVLVVAPLLLFAWVKQNPMNCVHDYDLPMAVIAVGALLVSLVPIAVRLFLRQVGRSATDPRLGDAWTLPDLGLVAAMIVLLLFMRSGLGRMVVYDGCGIIGIPGGVPITPVH